MARKAAREPPRILNPKNNGNSNLPIGSPWRDVNGAAINNFMIKKKERGLFLIEVLATLAIIGFVAAIVGVAIYDNFFQPEGGKRVALLISTLCTHTQGWAIESGNITIMEIDLSDSSMAFYYLDGKGNKNPLPSDILRKRKLPEQVKFVSAETLEGVMEDGKVQFPYFSSGFSKEGLITMEDSANKEIWTIHLMKYYGETKIYQGLKSLTELAIEENTP
jgi:hypothetical protein